MNEMINYEEIGLKSGIEIHAQLEGKKLFCECPTIIREDKPHFEIKRRLKAVIGETGKIDVAAQKEQEKKKEFVYQGYRDSTCLVEIDEEPPHIMNKGALNLALQMCKYFNCKIINEVQIMRKTVVDGSNTSGFQRTSLVGYNGKLKISKKNIIIESICLEEDACKIVERKGHEDIYNLSRLGIPLIEIATGPDMKTAEEVKETAEEIGMYLRSLEPSLGQSIKRGLGTIRQDVNVSIAKGERVEIKGAQDLKMITTLVDFEALRQIKLCEIKDKIKNNEIKIDLNKDYKDVSAILKHTSCKFIKNSIDNKEVILGLKINNFKGIFGEETCPGRRVGSEISDYGKLAGLGGMIHSDEDLKKKYQFTDLEIDNLKSTLEIKENDLFILLADKKNKCIQAIDYIIERINLLEKGVLKEVRKANPDGTTSFMRPMPGGARMYPETDTLPIRPNLDTIKLGKTIKEKIKELISKEKITNQDIAEKIAKEYYDIYFSLKKLNLGTNDYIATQIIKFYSLRNDDKTSEKEKFNELNIILSQINIGKIAGNSFDEIIEMLNKKITLEKAIELKETLSKEKTIEIVKEVLNKFQDSDISKMGLLIGEVMKLSKGKADGKIVQEIILKILNSKK